METIEQKLSKLLQSSIESLFPDLSKMKVEVISTNDIKFGDYQTNIAMKLKKQVGIKNPKEIAEKILNKISSYEDYEILEKIEIAGPGFINIFLKNDWIIKRAKKVLKDDNLGVFLIGKGKTVIIDYSSPNIAKIMHIGHLRSTIIGAALYNILKFVGYKVIGDNHIGDWGTQFGKLIVGYNNWLNEEKLNIDPVLELERLYVEFEKHSKKDTHFNDKARDELVKLQQGDEQNRKLWEKFVKLSMQRFDRVYKRLNVHFDRVYGESYYNSMLKSLVEELKEKGIAQESEGAYVIFLDEFKLHPYMIQKSDGAYLYPTTEIATLKYRIEKWNPAMILIVTDNRQNTHFKQLSVIAKKLNWDKEVDLIHVNFGRLTFNGEIMCTRGGNVIKLEELLDEAIYKAKIVVDKTSPHITEDERIKISEAVGIATIKYFDLSQNRTSDITFDWNNALALQGNTATYLLYAYARIQSIFKKYSQMHNKNISSIYEHNIKIVNNDESSLLKKALKFPEIVSIVVKTLRPNIISDYIYNLAQEFSSFYNKHRIINPEDTTSESRLLICEIIAKTLKKGLELLTIKPLDRM